MFFDIQPERDLGHALAEPRPPVCCHPKTRREQVPKLSWSRSYIMQDQEGPWLCWAAAIESMIAYYVGQTVAANKLQSTLWRDQKTLPQLMTKSGATINPQTCSAKSLEEVARLTGYFNNVRVPTKSANSSTPLVANEALFQAIKQEIDAGHPILVVFRIKMPKPPGHCGLIYGYEESPRAVYVEDPHATNSKAADRKYSLDDFCDNYRGQLRATELVFTETNEWANLGELF